MENNLLKLKIGQRYVLRNGKITEPIQKDKNGTNYEYFFVSNEGYFKHYLFNGRYLSHNIEHSEDIIKEL